MQGEYRRRPEVCTLKAGIVNARCRRCGYHVGPYAGAFARCWAPEADQTEGESRRDLESWKQLGRAKP